jgi:hypothetical protein
MFWQSVVVVVVAGARAPVVVVAVELHTLRIFLFHPARHLQ